METLFFIASKLFWLVVRPESWIVLLLGVGLWSMRLGRVETARKMVAAVLFLVLIVGLVPVGQLLMQT